MKPLKSLAACMIACCLAPAAMGQYCGAGSERCNGGIEQITRVVFNTIDNQYPQNTASGAANPPCYQDFTSISTDLYRGQSYTFVLTDPYPSTASGGDQAKVWVDWNQNFSFDDPGEGFGLVGTNGNAMFGGVITVPSGAPLGATRLRVRVTWNGTVPSCGEPTQNFGSVQDYTVNVLDTSVGACCAASGACSITLPGDCTGGVFQGLGTACAPTNPCGGACCAPGGSCTITLAPGCVAPSIFLNHVACLPAACMGVCCDESSGVCATTNSGASGCTCGTTWRGVGSTCSPTPCSQAACCNNVTGACSLTASSGCPAGSTLQSGSSSCSPNPCGGVCCNTTSGACTVALNAGACATGTTFGGAGSVCTPNPCGGACCNNTTGACTVALNGAACASGTTFVAAGAVCSPVPCVVGACCNSNTGACTSVPAAGCATAPANNFQGNNTFCSPAPCATGACCNNTTGACTSGGTACAAGLTFQGANTVCTPVPCSRGACCNNTTGACTTAVAAANCASGSTFQGVGIPCTPSPCLTGACCVITTGVCSVTTAAGCAAATSTYNGDFSTCTFNPCSQGACCNNTTGACSIVPAAGCTTGSTFLGTSAICGPNPCGTGACCVAAGTCTTTDYGTCLGQGGTYVGPNIACPSGNCFAETEPNETKFTANGPFVLGVNDRLVGFSSSSSALDYFQVQPPALTPGIYRHVLRCTSASDVDGTAGHLLVSRGISQIDGFADYHNTQNTEDTNGQISAAGVLGTTPAKSMVWFGFGQSEIVNFRVQWNGTATPASYVLALTSTPITPTDLGTLPGGYMTFTTVGQTTANTDMWLYDSNFHSIPDYGNDDVPNLLNHAVLQSQVTKDILAPGVYYLALCDSVLMVDRAGVKPPLERDPNNAVADPGTALCTSGTVNVNLSFAITDGAGVVHPVAATKVNGYDILWYKITVAAPATGGCCKADGSCVISSQAGCTSTTSIGGVVIAGFGGTYGGDSSTCLQACPQPATGACCQLDGTCIFRPVNLCTSYSGAWHGVGSLCTTTPCPGVISGDGVPLDVNTSGGQQAGLFVDITAGPDPITVDRIDYYCVQAYNNAPLSATGALQNPMQFVLFVRQGGGSYVGFEGGLDNPGCEPPAGSNWIINTDTGQTLSTPGNWQTTAITLTTPVAIPAGQTQGFYITSKFGGLGYRLTGSTMFAGTDGVIMHSEEGRGFSATANPGWNSALSNFQNSFNGRIFYSVTGAGVCCRGSTCNANVSQSNCTTSGVQAGANFTTASSACNSGPNTAAPCCYADYNKLNGVSVQDIFDFLGDWFAGSIYAKVGGNGVTGTLAVQDIFDFLNAWFAGGC